MDNQDLISNTNKLNFKIKQLIDSFCNELTTTVAEFNQNAVYDVPVEQIRQVLAELALFDTDLILDYQIIEDYKKEHAKQC